MKKIALLSTLCVSLLGSYSSKAQAYSLDKDTSKKAWVATGYLVEVHIAAENKSGSDVTINWKITSKNIDAGWKFDSFCDNFNCYYSTESGMLDGSKSFTTFPISSASSGDFKMSFNGDDAANYTKAVVGVEFTDGTTTKTGVFYAYKGTLGISTSFKLDDDVAIYPNPASNYIDVHYSSSSDVKSIAVYNLIGKLVNVYKVTDKSSARCQFTTDMPSGIYLMRISDSKGNIIATRKFTRQ